MKEHFQLTQRRTFLKSGSALFVGAALSPMFLLSCKESNTTSQKNMKKDVKPLEPDLFFKMSLAQWSFHRALRSNNMDTFSFIDKAKELGFEGVEYVNQFFKDKAEDMAYLDRLNAKAKEHNLIQNLIMIDEEGGLGLTDNNKRKEAIENHYKWVHAAKYLGCGSIRVNAYGEGTPDEVSAAAIDGLSRLSEYAEKENINVIVENHGGYSSNGKWMANVLEQVNMDNCGSLPDFGNFCIKRGKDSKCEEEYDRYQGMKDLMPFAKAVSAKSHDFDDQGNEIHTNYMRVMKIVKDSGFRDFVNVEYEGNVLGEEEGVINTVALLKKVGAALG
ncbi:MAG: sugar phosphate isomerase/epimerase family protein [Saprospiraceae bacterium]